MKILLQTTIERFNGEWDVAKFSKLAQVLGDDGHVVVCRNREPGDDGSDPVLSTLEDSDFDQLWLMAVDRGNALSPKDVRSILRFRERGGGILTAREDENIGSSLLNLGTLGAVNHFKTYNRTRSTRSKTGLPGPAWRRVVALEPVHEVLRSSKSPTGVLEYLPAHPHDGAISVPEHLPYARAIAATAADGEQEMIDLAIAIENEQSIDGHACGRAIAVSSIHHFADPDWDMIRDPASLEAHKDYARNIARWLSC
ncbi:MAG TPA: hypothetical protein VFA29_04480 [Candidatus Baltobacteraceae bacterium]|nr:hypothetical protein [Candidatus Baltobacteraceae bacterium]